MRLVAFLYFVLLGYAFAKTHMDEQVADWARARYAGLVRETVTVYRQLPPAGPVLPGEVHHIEGPCE